MADDPDGHDPPLRVLASAAQAYECLPIGAAMDLIEAALVDSRAARIAPTTLGLEDGTAFRIVAGATGATAVVRFGAAGRFWATGRTHLATWAAVFDQDSGQLRAMLRFPLTGRRVAATLGVAARALVAGPVPVTMVGAGNYAFEALAAVHAGTGIASLTVVSRTPAHARALAARAGDAFGVAATTAPDVPVAVAGATVVVVGTDSPTPVLHAGWLHAGQLVLSYGQPTELDRSVYLRADGLAASDVVLELSSGTVAPHPLATDSGQPQRVFQPLGDLLPGRNDDGPGQSNGGPGRTTGLTVVRDGGGGIGDAALAAGLAAEAERRGLGILVPGTVAAAPPP